MHFGLACLRSERIRSAVTAADQTVASTEETIAAAHAHLPFGPDASCRAKDHLTPACPSPGHTADATHRYVDLQVAAGQRHLPSWRVTCSEP